MPFRAELNYTRQDMKQFDKVHQKLRYGLWYALSNLLLILGCLAVLTSGILAFALGAWSREIGFYWLLVAFLLVLLIVMRAVRQNASLKSANAQGTVTLTTDESGIHAQAATLSSDFGYDAYCDLVHYRDTYYLYIDKRKAQIVPERCFTQGDPAAFGAFLTEKTGLTVKEIN